MSDHELLRENNYIQWYEAFEWNQKKNNESLNSKRTKYHTYHKDVNKILFVRKKNIY